MRTKFILMASVVTLVTFGVTACASGAGDAAPNDAVEGGGSLNTMITGGTLGDAVEEVYFNPFTQETGITIQNDPGFDYAKISTGVDAGSPPMSMAAVSSFWSQQQCGTALLPLDTSVVDLTNIDPALIQDECSAPYITYLQGIYYDTSVYSGAEKPSGCRDFFDVERFPGKRSTGGVAIPNALMECALIADGVSRTELYPLDVERAINKIETIKDDLIFWNSSAQSQEMMVNGEAAMFLAYNGRAYGAIVEQSAPYAPAYGDAFGFSDGLAVPKGAANVEQAMQLINFMLDAQRQAQLTTYIPYAPSNTTANLDGVPEEMQPFIPGVNPELQEALIPINMKWWSENAAEAAQAWEQVFVG